MAEAQSDVLHTQVMTQLAFNGQCREAFELYESVLGGRITVMNTFGGSAAKLPPGSTASAPDQIRFAELQVGGHAILGNDVPVQDYKPAQGFNIDTSDWPCLRETDDFYLHFRHLFYP